MPDHDPTGWEQRCCLNIIDDRGQVTGICNVLYRVHWVASQHKAKPEPHDCRAELALRAAIVAQRLDEVKP